METTEETHETIDTAPLALEAVGLGKTYPNGTRAVSDVDLSVPGGEIRAIVGQNGAGKSTLMKLLYGLEQPSAGHIRVHGERVRLSGPQDAIALGVGMVHQNLMLVPSFTIAENVVLGVEPSRTGRAGRASRTGRFNGWAGRVDRTAAVERTAALAAAAGLAVDPEARVDAVSVGMRQRAEILKVLHRGARILILDEPTAVLTPQETTDLFTAVRGLRDSGMTVLFISHKLKEVREISDQVTVMRAGSVIGTVRTEEATPAHLASMMVGREMSLDVPKPPARPGANVLRVRGLSGPAVHGVSLDIAAGEIVGLAGVEGNGQTELVELLAGLRRPTAGTVTVDDADVTRLDAAGHRRAGIAHVPEDRLTNGAALDRSLADNLIVDRHDRPPVARHGILRTRHVRELAEDLISRYAIRAPHPDMAAGALSGGNLQKVVVARELSARPRLLLAAQLTRGVDIGAMHFMYERLVEARDAGAAVLLVSADLGELLALSDRLLVIKDGRLVARFDDPAELTEEATGLYMLGVERHPDERITAGVR
ncbi:ABC transporter ATP-binding protein [Streptomyces sp. NBC_00878]|uniref:ABC transporter ATP-binding protein n=1 Tax=Streptomyces sp. NBC_00878 TaxID=2975854 RepID=UPI00224EBAD0|nr:ABC transporter ATP-binding protein [Streptomyces sp. NBC_00878]MCX4909203.1 ABC transporter ATP-binding protein [Streptomyces sp. NBC_00878]